MNPETQAAVEIIKTAVILLKRHVDWERALKTLSHLESEISQPSFWDNQENAQKVMREKTHLDSQVTAIRHLEETLTDFAKSIDWLLNTEHADNQLEEAVLGVIAAMDKPSSPAGEAKAAFYNRVFGRSIDQRMTFRERVLATTFDELKAVAERYFVGVTPSVAVITSANAAQTLKIEGLEVIKI